MAEKVRWGVIGAGGIAQRRTIPGMMKCEYAELVAVMEVNMELAEKCRAMWNCPKAYDSVEELLADPQIDAIYIASPVFLHAQQAIQAANAGKHILLEKPLAMSADDGQIVVDHCRRRGVLLAAGLMMRYGSHIQQMRQAIRLGKIGKPVSAYAQFTCWYPDMPGNWRQSKKNGGGGALMDMGVHCVDLLQYVLGSNAVQVAALHDTQTFHYEVEDSSTVVMRMDNGAQCVVQSNFNIPDEAARWRLEVFGDQGRLLGDGVIGQIDGGKLELLCTGSQQAYSAQQDGAQGSAVMLEAEFGDLYEREIRSFCLSILRGSPVEVPGQEAVDVQRILEAAYRSAETGMAVRI